MRPSSRLVTVAWLFSLAALAAQGPTFHGSINLLRLDVTVVTDDGTPVTDLKPEEFVVTVDGRPRPVRSAEFVDLRSSGGDSTTDTRDPARSFSTNSAAGHRTHHGAGRRRGRPFTRARKWLCSTTSGGSWT